MVGGLQESKECLLQDPHQTPGTPLVGVSPSHPLFSFFFTMLVFVFVSSVVFVIFVRLCFGCVCVSVLRRLRLFPS